MKPPVINHGPKDLVDFNAKWYYKFLSNFHPSKITHAGIQYPTVEHAYQACKTLELNERRIIAVQNTPALAKSCGRALDCREDWDFVKQKYMRTMLRKKFSVGSELSLLLLGTDNRLIVEGNTWGDTYWGAVRGRDGILRGWNNLGKLLMARRAELFAIKAQEWLDG